MFLLWKFFKPTLEISFLWFIYYQILVFIEGTRAFQVFKGIFYLIVAFAISEICGFDTLSWLLTKFFGISIIAMVIIFQQEFRQGLARLGQHHLFNFGLEDSEVLEVIDQVASAAFRMSRQKIGCLIAIEKTTKLKTYIESGIHMDAKVSAELTQSIFTPHSPLHDGGVIIRGGHIIAASCLFPLSDNPNFSKILGTRHRAALGITEQTDSIVVMVSEETGEISIATDGRFIPIVNKERFINILINLLVGDKNKKKARKNEKMATA